MKKNNTSQIKDYILIVMGLVISIAGIIFIIKQYRKLLAEPSTDEEKENHDRTLKKIRNHFKQVQHDEGTSPELLDEGDLAIELE